MSYFNGYSPKLVDSGGDGTDGGVRVSGSGGTVAVSTLPDPPPVPSDRTTSPKHRSSSVHSITSAPTRSMSIVSIDSPRNSIVSIDDHFIRPTRNSSNTSLVSLNHTAIERFSDDDFDSVVDPVTVSTPSRQLIKPIYRLKRGSQYQDHLDNLNLKSDFRFRYSDDPPSPSILDDSLFLDPLPSPLSAKPKPKPKTDTTDHKKKATPAIPSKLYLKKIYSKELQFEMHHKQPTARTEMPIPKKGETVSTQNKLINELNQKWNKAGPLPAELDLKDKTNLRKRSRTVSFSDDDDYYDNDV